MIRKLLLSILLLFILNSCDKYFHQEDFHISQIDNSDELEQAVNATYGLLGQAYNSMNGHGFYMINLLGDDMNFLLPRIQVDCEEEGYWSLDENWQEYVKIYKADSWEKLYKGIVSINNILTQFPDPFNETEEYRELIGEAYFLRAYHYFRLARTYEKVLLIDDIEINYNQEGASILEIYQFIEDDLNQAQKLLPDNRQSSRIPGCTPHRGVAKALLAEVYLAWAGYPLSNTEKYSLAAKTAGDIIDSASYYGFSLLPDFARLWDNSDYYNEECVFGLHFADPNQATIIEETNNVYRGLHFHEVNDQIRLGPTESLEIWFFTCELNFYNNYPQNYRKEITFYTRVFIETGFDFETGLPIGYYETVNTLNPCSRMAYRKFYYAASILDGGRFNELYSFMSDAYFGSSKVYLLRFAQTLLTYSEASARSGNLDEKAYECLNKIRRRANGAELNSISEFDVEPGLSIEEFSDSVVWERAWELAGEPEGRWFDLLRLDKAEEFSTLRHPLEQGIPELPFTREEYFFPVPVEESFLNPNLQN